MMTQDGTCLISRSSRKENYGGVMEKSDNYFQGKRYVAALIAAMTLLSGAGFTASVASADTDTVGYETGRIAFSGARTVCGEYSIDFAALTRSRMFLIDGGRRGTEGPDTDYQCPGGIIGFDNCSNAGYGSAEIIRPTDVKGKKKPDSSRPYLCFLAEHMNVPPADDAVYYPQE